MNALQGLARRTVGRRMAAGDMTLGDVLQLLSIDGPMFIGGSALRGDAELPPATLEYMASIFGGSSIVAAALGTRWKLFAQARYQFQQMFGGREGALFGTPDLATLEHPEPGETTLDLNFRAMQYADLGGDWFGVRRAASVVRLDGRRPLPFGDVDRIKPLRPDWTVVALGSRRTTDPNDLPFDPDAEIIGFGYTPGGPGSSNDPIAYGRGEVAHFHPNTGPLSRYRGLPLLLSVLPEILADNGANQYRRAFLKNAATPNLAVSFPPTWDETKAQAWLKGFERKHTGAARSFKTMYLGGGMDVKAVGGANFRDMAWKEIAGQVETRVAAVTGMHPVVIPFSEGLAGAGLSAGNYGSAKRSTADITLRFLWPNMCGSLETIVQPPAGTRLWYDPTSVPFLHADITDQATVMQANAETIGRLVNEGFSPVSAVDAVTSGDMKRLVHTGLVSVQLQEPGNSLPGQQARALHVSPAHLRALLGQGWTPASAADEDTVRHALATDPARTTFRATRRFWPAGGALSPEIAAGTILPSDDPRVLAYPSLFEAVTPDAPTRSGPARLVSREQIEATRQRLLGDGRPTGQASIAAELNVSRDTVRRALAEPN